MWTTVDFTGIRSSPLLEKTYFPVLRRREEWPRYLTATAGSLEEVITVTVHLLKLRSAFHARHFAHEKLFFH